MIGLLQSGTGTGNGIRRPISASGLLEESLREDLLALDRAVWAAVDAARAIGAEPAAVGTPEASALLALVLNERRRLLVREFDERLLPACEADG